MQHLKMNGELYKELVINGAANLALHYKEVDALNVFPVPDGDTGTNMRMTIEAGANAITYTPPSTAEIFESIMKDYRENA